MFLDLLGYAAGDEVYDPIQKVNLCLFTSKTLPAVEVITPSNEPGPLDRILKSRDEAPYHYCYVTENLEKTLASFSKAGCRAICVSSPKPAVLFGGRHVSFYLVQGFGLIELLEAD